MSVTRRSFAALSLGALAAPGMARAQGAANGAGNGGMTVIELFTSQGCSSCPAADALMVELAKEPGMIPLTFPVQIWDYLGWRDTLARTAFTERQKAYAWNVAGKRVYTPQAIINGRAHCVGSDFASIARLKNAGAGKAAARLGLTRKDGGWAVTASLPDATEPVRLVLLPLASRVSVQIGRGENSGRTITYANVVRDIRDLGVLGAGAKSLTLAPADFAGDGADGFALLIQAGDIASPGRVLAGAIAASDGVKA